MTISKRILSAAGQLSSRLAGSGVTPVCTKCNEVIPGEDINVSNDVAYCRACNLSHSLSQLTRGTGDDYETDLSNPPAGAWYRSEGSDHVAGASHRSLAGGLGALAICLFWNGIVSVFVLIAIAGTLRNLHWHIPEFFPAPNINDSPMSVGMTIFLWIFLTPFIVIGLALVASVLSCFAGRTEVRIRNSEAVVFTGIAGLGWKRRFNPAEVQEVRLEDQQWRDSDGDRHKKSCVVIRLRQGRTIKLGSVLTQERRHFLACALRLALRTGV